MKTSKTFKIRFFASEGLATAFSRERGDARGERREVRPELEPSKSAGHGRHLGAQLLQPAVAELLAELLVLGLQVLALLHQLLPLPVIQTNTSNLFKIFSYQA